MGQKLSKQDHIKVKKNILKRLYSNQAFSKGHLLYERLTSGIPPHLRGFVTSGIPPHLRGFVKDILDELVKEELVLFYGKTKYGDAYQLNIKKLKEIEDWKI